MHTLLFLIAVPLALANASLSPRYAPLLPRQSNDAFIPSLGPTVTNCPTPCGNECLDVPRGDTCCAEGYGCPGGSFCLTQGYCCPDGDDPSDCAANYGVSLSAGFQASNTVPVGTVAATSSAIPVLTTTAPTTTTFASPAPTSTAPTTTVSTSPAPTSTTPTTTTSASPAPTSTAPVFTSLAKNATGSAPPPATGTGAAPGGVVTFTAGADVMRVGGIGAIIGGIVGFMLL